ncbi:MAG: hypothetical protein NTX72_00730 [Candidatus Uhrbacteria bacterium]|nr:hypothetical protein [Candidatus Uhrbacteria bacterium]
MLIASLMKLVQNLWPCTEIEYSPMKGKSKAERKRLERHHTLLHHLKAIGRLSDALESHDHGAPLDHEALRKAIGTMFMNLARIATACDITPGELENFFTEWSTRRAQEQSDKT